MSDQTEMGKKIGEIMAKCWADEAFKQRLLADANATLKAEGIAVPEGLTVKVVENTGDTIHYVLPRNPKSELSDADLASVAGGKCESNPVCGLPIPPLMIPMPN